MDLLRRLPPQQSSQPPSVPNINTTNQQNSTVSASNETRNEAFDDVMNFIDLAAGVNDRDGGATLTSQQQQQQHQQQQYHHSQPLHGQTQRNAVKKESLDNIAKAGRAGGMRPFTSKKSDTLAELEKIRKNQINIFRRHMQFDIFAEETEDKAEFNSKEFLSTWQKEYHRKETELDNITQSMTELAKQIDFVNKSEAAVMLPDDPGDSSRRDGHSKTTEDLPMI